jgi:hypothetical protein
MSNDDFINSLSDDSDFIGKQYVDFDKDALIESLRKDKSTKESDFPPKMERKIDAKKELVNFADKNILQVYISDTDSSQIFGLIKVNGHFEVINLGTKHAKEWLTSQYYKASGEFHSQEIYDQTLFLIQSQAKFNNKLAHREINKRVASDNDSCYIDLGNDDFKLVKITANKVEIIEHGNTTPIFNRSKNQTIMPTPTLLVEGNPLEEFAKLVRMEDDSIFIPHLIVLFLPHVATPIMFITGQEDSAKSSRSALVKKLVDPSGSKLDEQTESFGRNIDDINVHFANNYLSVFDNVSYITNDISDTLCKAITGSSYSKRKNYSDDEEVILKFQRKIIMNGIGLNIEHSDLARRTIHYFTKKIPKEERKTLKDVMEKFKGIQSSVLGQICNTLSVAYQLYPEVSKSIKEIQGMADFAIWGECISQALGNKPNKFLEDYKARLEQNSTLLNENNCIIPFLESEFSGTDKQELVYPAGMWHGKLTSFAEKENYDTKFRGFPKGAGQLRAWIERSKPLLDQADFQVRFEKNTDNPNFTKGSTLMYVAKKSKQESLV